MTTIFPLPEVQISELSAVKERRPVALLTGARAWNSVNALLELPIVAQAEPDRVEVSYLDDLAANLPKQVEVVYGVGGGLVSDVAKYLGWKRKLPVVIVPTVLSQDGYFTSLVAARNGGTTHYIETGPVSKVIMNWDVIRTAPPHVRGAGIIELLCIVTGLLDWRYAAEHNKTTFDTRFQPWAAGIMAGIAQQAFKIAAGVGKGNVESLRNLLDLMCLEVQLTNQIGHNRPQEGSEQFFAYAYETKYPRSRPLPYADRVAPGLLIAAALHGQDVGPIRDTLASAGLRTDQLPPDTIRDTLKILPEYVRKYDQPYSILNDLDLTSERIDEIMQATGFEAKTS
ncbi:MAG: iron-containing alcohol dehydrogenase [Pleurocapsa minor GSE-CHR-MK-17-07R]|jgi:glycerol-1-phosphate dehydrogenase [NAD(P)+]|nr:iron-containing alcohol dehydrogenase [Pleurocapsa minor GSE-CHR-MK 17-07R]